MTIYFNRQAEQLIPAQTSMQNFCAVVLSEFCFFFFFRVIADWYLLFLVCRIVLYSYKYVSLTVWTPQADMFTDLLRICSPIGPPNMLINSSGGLMRVWCRACFIAMFVSEDPVRSVIVDMSIIAFHKHWKKFKIQRNKCLFTDKRKNLHCSVGTKVCEWLTKTGCRCSVTEQNYGSATNLKAKMLKLRIISLAPLISLNT